MESAPHNLVHSRICQEIDQIMMALRSDITNFEEDSSMCAYFLDLVVTTHALWILRTQRLLSVSAVCRPHLDLRC